MVQIDSHLSTGMPCLDKMLKGLIPGDNIVWQIDTVKDYDTFVPPFCKAALERGRTLTYFRFARHGSLIPPGVEAQVVQLHPKAGFENFILAIHRTIEANGRGGYYVFDCLTDLAEDWYSDQMLGNFFKLTCPYLLDMEAIAYFGLLRNRHSFHAITPIIETTQVFLDVYNYNHDVYLQPLKVQRRYSSTMFMLHHLHEGVFRPVTESAAISEILTSVPQMRLESTNYRLGIWNRTFLQIEEMMNETDMTEISLSRARKIFHRLLRMSVSRDARVLQLAEKYLTLADLVEIGKRVIGSGLIGGKSVGMLLARAILKRADKSWAERLEAHDSFYIGSDVFYTYLVDNGIWWFRQMQREPEHFMEGSEIARQRMIVGHFPEHIKKQFESMLDYYGQSPIIVRSSSLLEDNFGNSFAGKYESVFCVNQGPREKRLEDFMSAVRQIYTSAMSAKALAYRAQRGMLEHDEQMGLLVQRVSGILYENLFYPQIAGVAFSFNPYVWSPYIDPNAGMVRLVFGLGTRAVDRTDDDYTRVVALNEPHRRPESNFDRVCQYAQRKVDTLDLVGNQLVCHDIRDVVAQSPGLPLERFASRDENLDRLIQESNLKNIFPWVLTFNPLFETNFIQDMRQMLQILRDAYMNHVDVEFTMNFSPNGEYKINLVQCRPFQVYCSGISAELPPSIDAKDLALEAHGAVIGHSRVCPIDRIVYVNPAVYGQLPISKRYSVARLIGKLNLAFKKSPASTTMLIGPGRWGTTTPSLGVPVTFADINTVSVICEIVAMRDDMIPDVSLGTHFFNEIVEMDMLYLALFPTRAENRLNREILESASNSLLSFLPSAGEWADAIRVIEVAEQFPKQRLMLNANTLNQCAVCYLEPRR